MPRIILRNHKVHYQQMGKGSDIVLIHGLSCHIAFWWFHVAPQLAKTHRVTGVDLRGHGFTSMTESGYRPCDLAEDVECLLEHLGIEEAQIVGHSFGGAVATALTTKRPDLVKELTLADGWLPSLQPVPPLLSEGDWNATLSRARARGITVDANMPLVVRGLYKEVLDEQEYQSRDVFEDEDQAEDPATWDWEDSNWSRTRGRLFRLRRGGTQLGRSLWTPLKSRAEWLARMRDAQDDAGSDADDAPKDAEATVLKGAMLMTGQPGEASLALRRWQELMRRTNARAEYLDTSGIDVDKLGDISAPVRLVYGASSRYRPSAVKMKKLLPQARLRIVPRAGHYFPLLRPQGLLDAMDLEAAETQDTAAQDTASQSAGSKAEAAQQKLRLVVPSDGTKPDVMGEQTAKSKRYKPGVLQA